MTDLETQLDERLAAMSLEEQVQVLTGEGWWALHAVPSAGLRRLVVSDGPAGARGESFDERDPSANVPSPTALAATWDEAAVERVGRLLAAECRRKGVDVLLAPTVNLHRTPYGGRHFECFSEDPLLTARVGCAYVRGLQEEGVGATVKHFVANDTETDRFTYDARPDERTLRELYLAPFEAIVREARAWSVMAAYNAVHGHTMTESPLLRTVLQEEWGFDGVTMSDWYAARSLAAAETGLDLVMPGPVGPFGDALVEAVRSGRISSDVVSDKVRRILRLAARVGALDGVPGGAVAEGWSSDDVSEELRRAAAAGSVLVRNEPVEGAATPLLPLDAAEVRTVAVLGPNAAVARTLGGGSATVLPPYTVSPLDGLRAALPEAEVLHAPGPRPHTRVPVAPVGLLHAPDGSPGAEVRFLGPDGSLRGSEVRASANLLYQGAYVPGVAWEDVATLELRTVLRADVPGDYTVGCSGLGSFQLSVDGSVVFDDALQLPPGKDPGEGMMRPPQAVHRLAMEAGQEVPVVLRREVAPDPTAAFEVQMTGLQLNVERPYEDDDAAIDRAVSYAASADVAVVVVGTTEEVESEGFDRDSLALPGRQDELVRRVAAANPRTVVVVNAGAPVLLPWLSEVPATLLVWFPGQECGNALADVLLGALEPGGRLPTTWPAQEGAPLPSCLPQDGVLAYEEGLHVGHRAFLRAGAEPALWFGHGLGYTSWEHQGVEVLGGDGPLTVRVTVANTGARPGRDVVQVYASRADSTVDRPVRWLAGFAGVEAAPGDSAEVDVPLPRRAFEHWDAEQGAWVLEPGRFELHVGRSVADTPLRSEVSFP